MSFLYIHIPFCQQKCHYCVFDSAVVDKALFTPYVEALQGELQVIAERHHLQPLEGLFVGGGTPTVLPADLLCRLLETVFTLFTSLPGAEITIEANPGTVHPRALRSLAASGVNRLSLGVQSFADADLAALGRVHDAEEAIKAYWQARAAGFANINLDLMYGLPRQTHQAWQAVLTTALDLQPEHLSLYQLTLEEGTPLWHSCSQGLITLADDVEIAAMDECSEEMCTTAGVLPYEISNYARPGQECRHNCNYWLNGEYFAAGAAAVSCVNGSRERRVADPRRYIECISQHRSAIVEVETLPAEESLRESVVMALRMRCGVDLSRLGSRYGLDVGSYYGEVVEKLEARGLLEKTATHLRLTPLGRRFANRVMAELV